MLELATDEEQLADSKRLGGDTEHNEETSTTDTAAERHILCLVRSKSNKQSRRCRRSSSLDSISRSRSRRGIGYLVHRQKLCLKRFERRNRFNPLLKKLGK